MTPDRELDAQVAEKVLGKRPCRFKISGQFSAWATMWSCEHQSSAACYPANQDAIEHHHSILARYSTDIATAWEVLGRFPRHVVSTFPDHVACFIWLRWPNTEGDVGILREADTAPLAICRAALAAVSLPSARHEQALAGLKEPGLEEAVRNARKARSEGRVIRVRRANDCVTPLDNSKSQPSAASDAASPDLSPD